MLVEPGVHAYVYIWICVLARGCMFFLFFFNIWMVSDWVCEGHSVLYDTSTCFLEMCVCLGGGGGSWSGRFYLGPSYCYSATQRPFFSLLNIGEAYMI